MPSAAWLSVTPGSGTNNGAINVAASAATLVAGTYTANIIIYASASNTPLTIPVTLTVTGGSGRPAINEGGVVSAAGYQPTVARGAIASLFGVALANGVDQAASLPLPWTLGNARVTVNGVDAPLWFVVPGHINFQVPLETPVTGVVPVVVYRDGVASQSANLTVQEYAPGVFTYERAPGVFDPIITRADGSIVSPGNPAVPGDVLVVWGTGLGNLTVLPRTGEASPSSPLARSKATPTITVGGAAVEVQFSGLTPGAVGLAQFNIKLPASLPQKDSLPLVIRFGNTSSQPVNLAIRSTGPARPDVDVQLDDVQPRAVVEADNLTLRYTVKASSGFRGEVTRTIYISPEPSVSAASAKVINSRPVGVDSASLAITSASNPVPKGMEPGVYYVAVGLSLPGADASDPAAQVVSNSIQIQLQAQRPPFDLSVQLKSVSPSSVGPGDPIAVRYTVTEPGRISGTFSRAIYLSRDATITTDDTLVNSRTFDMLNGDYEIESAGNSIPRGTAPGNYFVGVIAQTAGDSNSANNISTALPLTVTAQRAPFDVGVQIVSVEPSTVAAGGSFSVKYAVKNSSKSTGIYNRSLYVSSDPVIDSTDVLVNTRTFELSGADDAITSSNNILPAAIGPGEYYVGIIVESAGDTNPADNVSNGVLLRVVSASGANAVAARKAAVEEGEIIQRAPVSHDQPGPPEAPVNVEGDCPDRLVQKRP